MLQLILDALVKGKSNKFQFREEGLTFQTKSETALVEEKVAAALLTSCIYVREVQIHSTKHVMRPDCRIIKVGFAREGLKSFNAFYMQSLPPWTNQTTLALPTQTKISQQTLMPSTCNPPSKLAV